LSQVHIERAGCLVTVASVSQGQQGNATIGLGNDGKTYSFT